MGFSKKYVSKMVKAAVLACCCGGVCFSGSGIAQVEAAEKSFNLPNILIEGERYYGGVMSDTATVGNMLGTENVMNLPINTTTLSEEAITTFAAPGQQMIDAVAVSPLVRRRDDVVVIRGYHTTANLTKLNGIGGMISDFESAGNFVESIDITAGPDLVYSGSNTAGMAGGGTVTLNSKRAKVTPIKDVSISFTGKSNITESVDLGKRFGKNDEYGVRINSLHQAGGLSVHGEKLATRNIFANIDRTTEKSSTNLLVGYEHVKHNGGNQQFRNETVDYIPEAMDGEHNIYPSWRYNEHSAKLITLNHNQKLNDNFSIFLNAGAAESSNPTNMSIGWGSNKILRLNPDGSFDGDFEYKLTRSASKSEKNYIGGGVRWNIANDNFKNEMVIGVDRAEEKNWKSESATSDIIKGNIYQNNTWDKIDIAKNPAELKDKASEKGVSVIDTLKLFDDKLIILGGVHHHSYQPYGRVNDSWKEKDKFAETVPTYGLLYKLTPNLSVYANHAETFHKGKRVGDGYKNSGELLDPYILENNEIGFKYKDEKQMHTIAFYKYKNPKNAMETEDNYLKYLGGRKYEGVEYTYAGKVNEKWDAFGGLSYNNMYTYNTGKFYDGNRQSGMPRLYGSVGCTYHADEKWDVIGRYMYTSTAPIDAENAKRVDKKAPVQSRLDLGFRYKTALDGTPLTIQAMCYNVTNHKYWYTNSMGSGLRPAEPRTFAVTATMNF